MRMNTTKLISTVVAMTMTMSSLALTPVCAAENTDLTGGKFVAAVDGKALDCVEVKEKAYTYTNFAGEAKSVDLYVVEIPEETETVDFTFEKACLAYNYDISEGLEVDDDYFLDGMYDDFVAGSKTKTVKVDSNTDGIFDAIQVQNTYNADWTGAEIQYAIQFVEVKDMTFKVKLDGQEVTPIIMTPAAYNYVDWTGKKTPVDLYLVRAHKKETAELEFPYGRLAYNYGYNDAEEVPNVTDDYFIEGLYEDFVAGSKAKTVKIDADGNGLPDIIQVQNTYNADYSGGEPLYAIMFVDPGHDYIMDVKKVNTKTSTGKAIVTCGECDYKETVIAPKIEVKKVSITGKSAKKKAIALTWKKQKKADGYQIRYSTKSSMAGAKKVYTEAASATIKQLSAKKKYYVQVRAYGLNLKGKKVFGDWSKKVSVKTK